MPKPTYEEPHWLTGKIKTRCSVCHKVTYPDRTTAKVVADLISERTPMRAYIGVACKNWHVTKRR